MTLKYVSIKDKGGIFVQLNREPYSLRLRCCDCGLTHDIKMLYQSNNRVEMIFTRNKISTALHRRHRGKNESK